MPCILLTVNDGVAGVKAILEVLWRINLRLGQSPRSTRSLVFLSGESVAEDSVRGGSMGQTRRSAEAERTSKFEVL